MKRKKLVDAGYDACMAGLPCEAPTTREQDRGAWEQGWRAAKNALNAEYAAGRKRAHAEYMKGNRSQAPNPHKDFRTELWRAWNLGWLAGCDEVLVLMRKAGKCLDV